ncbi:hypothetical protein SAMN02799630_04420 [Paenibacillus sp. UNCCL117]|uniref:DUF5325 family protein n=1 Tax=unclassified Paenibacillus TaxID=185978 RepID=UPI00088E2F2E|nr:MULTISPECIES: DUF5325 family protein [unclassified Paenibacillus]SDE02123.1 hypothetical protein SAMN04488602_11729 [Paenibacillus sp. cl123]SFW57151.1 hypothetical protein SAMN02799630_04420 [Paenibacillus sp. UNCCL117]
MNKPLALLYAVLGTALLAAISYFMAAGRPWMAVLASIVSLLFIGSGFIVKARQRRKREQTAGPDDK